MPQFNVRCSLCGECGSERRMNLEDGICYYCREEESTPCQTCGSYDASTLGTLGNLSWKRCHSCGMDFYVTIKVPA
ncbi:hypothetical protein LCGC14_1836970 [marine sediment metagenome]|uniref:Uncharacterized protein n=1 Tax=marine sediment metagenome TaxID=412755 RepID=A0A0F9JDT8_9ZZZZ